MRMPYFKKKYCVEAPIGNFTRDFESRTEAKSLAEELPAGRILDLPLGQYLISLEERVDTTSDSDESVFHVFGAILHFERRLISERTKDGLATVRKHGGILAARHCMLKSMQG